MNTRYRVLFLCLFFASGVCGLIYEIVWSRLLVFVFGGTTFAITTVLGCFMGGLAMGSWLGGIYCDRMKKPASAYGIIEILIGVYCLAVPFLLHNATAFYQHFADPETTSFLVLTGLRVGVCAAVLLLPTILMGATLPILTSAFQRRSGGMGGDVGRLYGINTIGAFLGCAGAGFFLLPRLGLTGATIVAAVINIVAGVTALAAGNRAGVEVLPAADDAITESSEPLMASWLLLTLFGLSGFAAMALQVAWTRALILSMGASTYAFTTIVACFIFGLAMGSLVCSLFVDRLKRLLGAAGLLEGAIAVGALIAIPFFGKMPTLVARLSSAPDATYNGVLVTEVFYVFALLLAPTFAMGALMPLVVRIYSRSAASVGVGIGHVYAANTVGTILGTLAAGFLFIPAEGIGVQRTIIMATALSGLIATLFLLFEPTWRKPVVVGVVLLWVGGFLFQPQPWSRNLMISGPYLGMDSVNPEEQIRYYREGIDTTVAVLSSGPGHRSLVVNGKPDASNVYNDMVTQLLLGHLPVFLKQDAKEVCVIGLGSGVTLGAVLDHPVDRVDVVEISQAVREAAVEFEDLNHAPLDDPRTRFHRDDGRNFLQLTQRRYDVIVSEPSNPWISGIANLFSRQCFQLALDRLKPGGIHCQWLHSYSMKADDFASIIRTFAAVFPHVQLWETIHGDYLLLGSDQQMVLDLESLYRAMGRENVAQSMALIKVHDPMQLANHHIAGTETLKTWLNGRENQDLVLDDLPRLEFSAPHFLLSDEDRLIKAELAAMDDLPILAGDTSSLLNAEFLRIAVDAHKARLYFNKTLHHDPESLQVYHENLVQLARYGANDPRILNVVLKLLSDPEAPDKNQNDPGVRKNRDNTLSRIQSHYPDLPVLLGTAPAKQGVFWPFSAQPRIPESPGITRLLAEMESLAGSGEYAEALVKATDLVRNAPTHFQGLAAAGSLGLVVEGPETAIPYLLRAWIMNPQEGILNYELARAYGLQNKKRQALDFLETAFTQDGAPAMDLKAVPEFTSLLEEPEFRELVEKLEQIR